MAYHSKGIGKNKKIREQRKKPLPLQLMIGKDNLEWQRDKEKYLDSLEKNNAHKPTTSRRGNEMQNPFDTEII